MKKFLWFSLFYLLTFSAFVVECSGGGADERSGGGADKYGNEKCFSSDDEDSALKDALGQAPVWDGAAKLDFSDMIEGYHAAAARAHAYDSDDEGGGGGGKKRSFSNDDEDCFGDDSDDSDDSESAPASAAGGFWGSYPTWTGEDSIGLSSMIAAYRAAPVGDGVPDDKHGSGGGGGAAARKEVDPVGALTIFMGGLELEEDDRESLEKLNRLIKDLEYDSLADSSSKKEKTEMKKQLTKACQYLQKYTKLLLEERALFTQEEDCLEDDSELYELISEKINSLGSKMNILQEEISQLISDYVAIKRAQEDRRIVRADNKKRR